MTDWDAVPGPEKRHSSDVFVCDVGGDDQDRGVGVTQLVVTVDLTDGPALVRQTLKNNSLVLTAHY